MSSAIGPEAWLVRCRSNIRTFAKDRQSMSREQQIEFIRDQYAILSIIRKVIDGNARLQGISQS